MPDSTAKCLQVFAHAVPKETTSSHKGQAGRLAVIGGSRDYTGAPYFAAMACMRAGADLATVYCHEEAAIPIKAYSPDLIVVPSFSDSLNLFPDLSRIHSIVLGPGLGRNEQHENTLYRAVSFAIEQRRPLVIDADALWFLTQSQAARSAIRDAPEALFLYATPNKIEVDRLCKAMGVTTAREASNWFRGRLVLVCKGPADRIMSGDECVEVSTEGAKKRVGGQGDILSGITALLAFWLQSFSERGSCKVDIETCRVAAAVAACVITRHAANRAYTNKGRSMLASDIVDHVGDSFSEVYCKNFDTADIGSTFTPEKR